MQIEQLLARGDVSFKKMGDTGAAFKERYPNKTPATSVVALDNWDSVDVQSVYYDCQNYTANLFRFEDKIFLRSLYLFDEKVQDRYIKDTCKTFDAVYENLPIVDTMACPEKDRKQCGLMIDDTAQSFSAEKVADGVLKVSFGDKSVTFFEDRIEISANQVLLYCNSIKAEAKIIEDCINLAYNGVDYRLRVDGATAGLDDGNIKICSAENSITLLPETL